MRINTDTTKLVIQLSDHQSQLRENLFVTYAEAFNSLEEKLRNNINHYQSGKSRHKKIFIARINKNLEELKGLRTSYRILTEDRYFTHMYNNLLCSLPKSIRENPDFQ